MAELKEEEYVHKVYNEIAGHFSQTRYKPWPIVSKFLMSREMGSIGIDVGCGNGKYLAVNPNIFILGSDRSCGLISCAHELNNDYNVLVADGMHLPHRDNTFDFAISIAVVHHWSTRERRVAAISHILNKVKPGGEILVYCWALEQADSRRGYQEGMEQDVLVPWVVQEKNNKNDQQRKPKNHIEQCKPDLSNVPKHERSQFMAQWKKQQDELRNQLQQKQKADLENSAVQETKNTKYRYYHLYRKGELEQDCEMAGCVIKSNGYEKDNWYVIAQKPLI